MSEIIKKTTTDIEPESRIEWDFESQYPHINQTLAEFQSPLPENSPRENIHYLLEAEHPEQEIQKLQPQVLYELFMTSDWEEAVQLLEYMDSYQVQCMIDMDVWNGDEISIRSLEKWFDALVDFTSDEVFQTHMRELDSEIPALLFKENLIAEPIEEDEEPFGGDDIDWHLSPDGTYALADLGDEDSSALMRKIINRMYDTDRVLVWTLLTATKWELKSDMEEQSYRWRTSRMEELGFPKKMEAQGVYVFEPPSATLNKWRGGKLAVKNFSKYVANNALALYGRPHEALLLFDALEEISGDERFSHIVRELMTLQNYSLIANGVEPGHQYREQAERESRRAIGYLNVGLEFLSQNDLNEAKLLLQTLPLRKIFSVGYSAALTVKQQVQVLMARATLNILEHNSFSLLCPENAMLFEALTLPRPETTSRNGNVTLFMTMEQVNAASDVVKLVAFKQLWLHTLFAGRKQSIAEFVMSSEIANSIDQITFDHLFATANANTLIQERDPLKPFDIPRLAKLINVLNKHPKLAELTHGNENSSPFLPFLEKIAGDFPPDALRHASTWLTETLSMLARELKNITDPNPNYLQSLLLIEK